MLPIDATPRQINEIEEQLEELRSLIEESDALELNDFASELGMRSMRALERKLQDELKAAKLLDSEAVVQISLDGGAVQNHAIDAKMLGSFLLHLQALTNAMGQASAGYATRYGAVQRRIVEENRLLVSSFMPSSFAVNFSRPVEDQLRLRDQDAEDQAGKKIPADVPDSMDFLYKFFDDSTPLGDLAEIVSIPKVKRHYTNIVDLLEKYGVVLEMRTRRQPFAARLTANDAAKRKQWITMIQNDVESLSVVGTLNSGHIRFNNFEIQDEHGNIFIGRTTDYAQYWIKHIPLGTHVRAEILKTTEKHGQTEVDFKTEYLLRLIEPVEAIEQDEVTA